MAEAGNNVLADVQQAQAVAVSPYVLSGSKNPGALVSSVTLNFENYEWSKEML